MEILYAWEWGAGAGHLRRFVPLATRLQRLGHKVTIVAKEIQKVPGLYPASRFSWLQAPDVGRASVLLRNPNTFADIAYNLGFDDRAKVLAKFGVWYEILRRRRPDLVILDFGAACAWIASALGIQTVRIGTGYSCPPTGAESVAFLATGDKPSTSIESILATVNASFKELGLKYDARWEDVLLPSNRTILASVPTLDPYAAFRDQEEYSGIWNHEGSFQPQWKGQGKYRAVAYLKPFPQLPRFLALLHSLSVETVLYGDGIPEFLIQSVRNPLLTLSDAPLRLSDLASLCDLVICNGNHGTSAASLAQGIPVFSVPLFLEQRVSALRLQREGWGTFAEPSRPDQFRDQVIRALSPAVREAASRYPGQLSPFADRGLEHAWKKLQAFLI